MNRLASAITTTRAVLAAVRENRVTFLAAAVAYYGFLSLVPLLLLAISVGMALGFDLTGAVVSLVGGMLTPTGEAAIANAVDASGPGSGITIVGTGVLVWSSMKVFRSLNVAFAAIYGAGAPKPLLSQVVDAAIALGAIAIAVVAAAGFGVIVALLSVGPLGTVLGPAALVVTLVVAFLPVYYRFPAAVTSPREALPGAVLAALGWTVLATVFGAYARFVPSFRLYGVLGAALLLVTWLYLSGIIIMVGAVVNAVLAGRTDDGSPDGEDADGIGGERRPGAEPVPDVAALGREVEALRDSLEEKTVSRADLESDLRRYVRRRLRRGKARGWGPYLVLLYGTVITLGAFYWLSGGWAILAMVIAWLSTLGLYVLLVLFGLGARAVSTPGALLDRVRDRRS